MTVPSQFTGLQLPNPLQRRGRKLTEQLPISCGEPAQFGEAVMSGELRDTRIGGAGGAQCAANRFQTAQAEIDHRAHTEMLRTGCPQGPLRNAKCRAKLNEAGRLILEGCTRILEAGHQVAVSFRNSS